MGGKLNCGPDRRRRSAGGLGRSGLRLCTCGHTVFLQPAGDIDSTANQHGAAEATECDRARFAGADLRGRAAAHRDEEAVAGALDELRERLARPKVDLFFIHGGNYLLAFAWPCSWRELLLPGRAPGAPPLAPDLARRDGMVGADPFVEHGRRQAEPDSGPALLERRLGEIEQPGLLTVGDGVGVYFPAVERGSELVGGWRRQFGRFLLAALLDICQLRPSGRPALVVLGAARPPGEIDLAHGADHPAPRGGQVQRYLRPRPA